MFDFVCLDECHNVHTEKREFLLKRDYLTLKLTATVHRDDIQDVVYFKSAKDAIEEKFI